MCSGKEFLSLCNSYTYQPRHRRLIFPLCQISRLLFLLLIDISCWFFCVKLRGAYYASWWTDSPPRKQEKKEIKKNIFKQTSCPIFFSRQLRWQVSLQRESVSQDTTISNNCTHFTASKWQAGVCRQVLSCLTEYFMCVWLFFLFCLLSLYGFFLYDTRTENGDSKKGTAKIHFRGTKAPVWDGSILYTLQPPASASDPYSSHSTEPLLQIEEL